MRGRRHSDETRAAVTAALLAGQGVSEVAREYSLTESTVRSWRDSLSEEDFAKVRDQKGHDFGRLVGDYLASILTTLQVQSEFFRREEWLAKQDAQDLAVLHGLCADKGIRLLEAAERAAEAAAERDYPALPPVAQERLP